LAHSESKGTPLKLFSGKEEPLNRLILQILRSSKQPLTKYDVALEVRRVVKFKHTDKNTVYRRMEALQEQDLISIVGERLTKPGWPSELYAINDRGIAALKLDKNSIEEFLLTASQEKLRDFNSIYPP
jgi:DNA-binding PadR family transcriptional regulator